MAVAQPRCARRCLAGRTAWFPGGNEDDYDGDHLGAMSLWAGIGAGSGRVTPTGGRWRMPREECVEDELALRHMVFHLELDANPV